MVNILAVLSDSSHVLRALIGVVGLLLIAYFLSANRKAINPRVVVGGLFLQFFIGLGLIYWGKDQDISIILFTNNVRESQYVVNPYISPAGETTIQKNN